MHIEEKDKYFFQKNFFQAVRDEKISEIKKYFESESICPWKFIEKGGYTALHRAAFMNSYELVSVLIEEMSKRVGEDRISKFVNKPTDHGFRAIHYASYKGNVDAIKLLMTYGADVHMKTKKGLNVLHLAAQGDQPSSLVYFMEKFKFNFNAEDRYGSTILHWACFAGAEYVFDLIISNYSQSLDLNKQDKEGLTPLHLSVISEKTNIIKRLLSKGVDFRAKDSKGRSPLDLAIEKKKTHVEEILRSVINMSFLKRLQTRCQNNYNSGFYVLSFLSSHLFAGFTTVCFLFPYFNSPLIMASYVILFSLILFFYVVLIIKDPGVLVKQNGDSLLELVESKKKIQLYCPVCVTLKTETSRHCQTCNKCIDNHDHHCYWVSNCIGKNNLHPFIIFITLIVINIFFNIILAIYCLLLKSSSIPNKVFLNRIPWKVTYQTKNVACTLILVLTSFFLIPVTFVFYKNMKNFINRRNKKNNEKSGIIISGNHGNLFGDILNQENEKANLIKQEERLLVDD